MIKATKNTKSASSVPYGILMILIFRCFGVSMEMNPEIMKCSLGMERMLLL